MVFCILLVRKAIVRKMKLLYNDMLNDWDVGGPIVFQHHHITGRVTVVDEEHVQKYFIKVLIL